MVFAIPVGGYAFVFAAFMFMVTGTMQRDAKTLNEARFRPLFQGAVDGDRKTYAALLTEISVLARRYVRRKLGDQADGDDIVQEILISVHKALPTYDPARACMPWLGAIMHFRLNDALRTRYHALQVGKVMLEDVQDFLAAPVTETPLAHEYVTKAVATLSTGQQAVLHAMYQEDLTVAETSEKLGLSVSAVKVTAHRAYKKLRERLEDE